MPIYTQAPPDTAGIHFGTSTDTPSVVRVYLLGDSLTGGTPGGTYQTYLAALLGANWELGNKGVDAETSTQIAARLNSDVIDPGDAGYCIVLAGTNNASAPATVEADLQAMYTALHNAGIRVVACTLPPRNGNDIASVKAINTWITTTAVNVDYTIDLWPLVNDPDNDGYWQASLTIDGYHPNEAGCEIIGTAIYNGVTWAAVHTLRVLAPSALDQALLRKSVPTFAGIDAPHAHNYSDINDPPTQREVLTAGRTYYVRTDGSDSNDGLTNTAGGAFATIQYAIDVAQNLDTHGYGVTIQIADGTYVSDLVYLRDAIGSGEITITGNATTPSNVVIDGGFTKISIGTTYHIDNLKLIKSSAPTAVVGIAASYGAKVVFRGVEFGSGFVIHVSSGYSGIIYVDGNYTISGGATYHLDIENTGMIGMEGRTVTLTGTPGFVAFAVVLALGCAHIPGNTFSGAATGARFVVRSNSVIDTQSAGADYLPGDSAGWADGTTGGQYL